MGGRNSITRELCVFSRFAFSISGKVENKKPKRKKREEGNGGESVAEHTKWGFSVLDKCVR